MGSCSLCGVAPRRCCRAASQRSLHRIAVRHRGRSSLSSGARQSQCWSCSRWGRSALTSTFVMLAEREHQLDEIIARADDARAGPWRAWSSCRVSPARARHRSSRRSSTAGWKTSACCGARATRCRRRDRSGRCTTSRTSSHAATQTVLAEQRSSPTTSSAPSSTICARGRRCSSSTTCTGPTRAPSTCSGSCCAASRRHGSLVVGIVRDDEVGVDHPLRALLGDVGPLHATPVTLPLPPLSLDAVEPLVGERAVDPDWLHRVTGGNAFFVSEMLDHRRRGYGPADDGARRDPGPHVDLDAAGMGPAEPADVRARGDPRPPAGRPRGRRCPRCARSTDAASSARVPAAWRSATTCAGWRSAASSRPAPSRPAPAAARRATRRRPTSIPAVLTHHALGAGDRRADPAVRQRRGCRGRADRRAHPGRRVLHDRAGAGRRVDAEDEAELLELLAWEFYLIDRCDDAISACSARCGSAKSWASRQRSAPNHHSLAVYQWYNANRDWPKAMPPRRCRCSTTMPTTPTAARAARARVRDAGLPCRCRRAISTAAKALITRAREIADTAGDSDLTIRVRPDRELRRRAQRR